MEYKNVYFLGIGGIGMSALARYFLHEGYAVAGYDRTPSHLTAELEAEGAAVHYEDDVRLIPEGFLDPNDTMVVYLLAKIRLPPVNRGQVTLASIEVIFCEISGSVNVF